MSDPAHYFSRGARRDLEATVEAESGVMADTGGFFVGLHDGEEIEREEVVTAEQPKRDRDEERAGERISVRALFFFLARERA